MIGGAFPLGFSVCAIIGLTINIIFGCTFVHYIMHNVFFGILAAALCKVNRKKKIKLNKTKNITKFILVAIIPLFYYVSTYIFPDKGHINKYCEDEMFLEVSLIASFSKGENKWRGFIRGVRNPLISNTLLWSEFIPPFYCGLLKSAGMAITKTVTFTTFLFLVSLFYLQYSLTYRFTKSEFAAILATPAVLFAGGFHFYDAIAQWQNQSKGFDFISSFGGPDNITWGHPFMGAFLASRVNLLSSTLAILAYIFALLNFETFGGILVVIIQIVRPQNGFFAALTFVLIKIEKIQERVVFFALNALLLFIQGLRPKIITPLWNTGYTKFSIFPPFAFFISIFGVFNIGMLLSLVVHNYYEFTICCFLILINCYFNFQNLARYNFATTVSVIYPLVISISYVGFLYLPKKFKNIQMKGFLYGLLLVITIVGSSSALFGIYFNYQRSNLIYEDDETELEEWFLANSSRTDHILVDPTINWFSGVSRAGRSIYYTKLSSLTFLSTKLDNRFSEIEEFLKTKYHVGDVKYIVYKGGSAWEKSLSNDFHKYFKLEWQNDAYNILSYLN
ncbi:hypothetical protein TVAG_370430 [Trichomonas vaginalis G3]|uniref:Glycosyltransferase RgtA/B/C/D-like domain-containing protein n=1 Tax=Trichomonas vaginalis (strain ATCC PRA-98 / G3) TaxID=412133 RepID=A2FJP0_TRIV3|nr:membrane protein [Trichomonas vaginalis G3]EAX94872.1 hypothetical protein TVAG_370430 [Trichomonas vaginalis G3]KAI5541504.1 membrane protein [Trichomonas vaginalis G3]|eukprot:XP_001307802.1 hypothetical protein [Trichomonas vaginalis G3]